MAADPFQPEPGNPNQGNSRSTNLPTDSSLDQFYPPEIVALIKSDVWAKNGYYPIVGALKLLDEPPDPDVPLVIRGLLTGVARVKSTATNGTVQLGSAFLIWTTGKQVLLTAGHLLAGASMVQVWMQGAGGLHLVTVNSWQQHASRDYGVIFISGAEPANQIITPMQVVNYFTISNDFAYVAGFSASGNNFVNVKGTFPGLPATDPNQIECSSMIPKGLSGGPMYVQPSPHPNAQIFAIGVQSAASIPGFSFAEQVNAEMRGQLGQWIGVDVCVTQP